MKRFFWSILMALLCLGTLVPAVGAEEEQWCWTDPAIVVRTPSGNTVVVYLTLGALGTQHADALRAATESYTVQAVSNAPATDVEVQVRVPDDAYAAGFSTVNIVSTQPNGGGTVLDSEPG